MNCRVIICHKEIARRYLKGFFLIDLVSSIPFNLFWSGSSANKLLRILKIPRLIRMFKLAKVLRLKNLYKGTKLSYFLKINGGVLKIMSLVFFTALILHFAACVLSAISLFDDYNYKITWIARGNFQDLSDPNIYLTAYYFALTTLTSIGYGDITPYTDCRI